MAGFDVVKPLTGKLSAIGGLAAETIAAACRGAEAIITMLPAGEHVRDVWLHQGGLIEAVRGAAPLLIDCSTIDVDSARHVAALAQKQRPTRLPWERVMRSLIQPPRKEPAAIAAKGSTE